MSHVLGIVLLVCKGVFVKFVKLDSLWMGVVGDCVSIVGLLVRSVWERGCAWLVLGAIIWLGGFVGLVWSPAHNASPLPLINKAISTAQNAYPCTTPQSPANACRARPSPQGASPAPASPPA